MRVVEEFAKHECYSDDDVLFHAVITECGVLVSELSELMKYLQENITVMVMTK